MLIQVTLNNLRTTKLLASIFYILILFSESINANFYGVFNPCYYGRQAAMEGL